jgi:hypothetical protein
MPPAGGDMFLHVLRFIYRSSSASLRFSAELQAASVARRSGEAENKICRPPDTQI